VEVLRLFDSGSSREQFRRRNLRHEGEVWEGDLACRRPSKVVVSALLCVGAVS